MLLKKGSKGEDVKKLQRFLGTIADGVFGNQTEKLVKEWQKKYDLVVDGIVGDETWNKMFNTPNFEVIGSGVMYNPIDKHISKCPNRVIKYLVIHYTASSSSTGDSESRIRNIFLSRNASADFIVDDDSILQVNPNLDDYFCWAIGDGKGKYGINNKDCISIEICSNLKKGTTPKYPNHEGWFFTEKSIDNAVYLSKMIMKTFDIPIERVIRHYDATRKLCPGVIGWNPGEILDSKTGEKTGLYSDESEWLKFKSRL